MTVDSAKGEGGQSPKGDASAAVPPCHKVPVLGCPTCRLFRDGRLCGCGKEKRARERTCYLCREG